MAWVPQTPQKQQGLSTAVGASLGARNPHFSNLWSKQLEYRGTTITLHQVCSHNQSGIIVPSASAATSSEQSVTSLSGIFSTNRADYRTRLLLCKCWVLNMPPFHTGIKPGYCKTLKNDCFELIKMMRDFSFICLQSFCVVMKTTIFHEKKEMFCSKKSPKVKAGQLHYHPKFAKHEFYWPAAAVIIVFLSNSNQHSNIL